MNRTILINISLLALAVLAVWLLVRVSYLRGDADRLSADLVRMQDSLALIRQEADSLMAERPGLGDYMSTIQLHVSKLWFAGRASNWELAEFEVGEIGESIDAAEALHVKKNDVDVSAVLGSVRESQLPQIERAIAAESPRDFNDAYRQTLSACNGCHRPAGYGFIHIIVPKGEPVTNQEWRAAGGK
jgi:hypothetical protein